jgi:hypothetical protein
VNRSGVAQNSPSLQGSSSNRTRSTEEAFVFRDNTPSESWSACDLFLVCSCSHFTMLHFPFISVCQFHVAFLPLTIPNPKALCIVCYTTFATRCVIKKRSAPHSICPTHDRSWAASTSSRFTMHFTASASSVPRVTSERRVAAMRGVLLTTLGGFDGFMWV